MAKQALLDVLEQTIGKYVKDLDAENLNLGIWNGRVELNSLELNVDAVNAELQRQAEEAPNLSLPFRVQRGSFGSFQIDVPWSRLMSQPVVLRAHGLNVSVEVYERHQNANSSPLLRDDNDLKRQKKILEARLQSILTANDTRLRKKAVAELANLDMASSKNTSGTGSTFGSRLVRRICENIQVEVNDVHISLESGDNTAGIVMESLTLFTTDARGIRSFVDRTSGDQRLSNSFLHKALQIRGLGIYLDEEKDVFHSMNSIEEVHAGGPSAPLSPSAAPVHSYILSPLSFETTLRQADSNACIDYPKYLLTSKLPALSILLSKSQLEFAARIAEQVNPSDNTLKPLFPEYRPLRRVTKDTAKEWWQYAVRCVGRLNGRSGGWKEFFLAFKRRKLYISLYKRDAHYGATDCHWLEPLQAKELRQLHDIENDRTVTVEGIMAWRNIADAQFDKEQEKFNATKAQVAKPKSSRRSFFFGTTTTTEDTTPQDPSELPPITLTAEEMKELETINLNQIAEQELSKDSKLCNIHFVLGSLRVNLTSYGMRPVAAFNMGRVAMAFKANADGSFVFGFKVSSLDIMDMVTPQSLYPNVLGSLRKGGGSSSTDSAQSADDNIIFSFNLSKSKDGDQTLSAKLVSFQAVASPILLKEVKKFFTLGPVRSRAKSVRNPMLARSVSGSVDLFYDANDFGVMESSTALPVASPTAGGGLLSEEEAEEPAPAQSTSATFSNALIEAWKAKTETKADWVVDLDIRAPILVLPENCVDESANVLILDLGHMKFQYGSIEEAPKIQNWFKNHPKSCNEIEPDVDSGKLGITNLQFMVTETASWHQSVAKQGSPDAPFESEAVVEPISINFDFAIETVAASEIPRGCAIGVVPSIVVKASIVQASRVLNVYSAWKRLVKESTGSPSDDNQATSSSSQLKESEPLSKSAEKEKQEVLVRPEQPAGEAAFSIFHVSLWLQRLSFVVDFEEEGGVDAHLVSVNANMSSMSDGSSITNLSMGWFWILDRFKRLYARKQRLVVHSSLPLEPHLFAIDEKYAILDELEKQGVFQESSTVASELANITYKSFAPQLEDEDERKPTDNQYESKDPFKGAESARVDAKFSSLYIHWNPQAVKTMTSMLGKFKLFLETSKSDADDDPLLIVAAGSSKPKPSEKPRRSSMAAKKLRGELFVINAEMKGFEICLNSARDDLPLFILHMSRAKVKTLSSDEGDLLVSLALGDLRLATPNLGETQDNYRTLLGLAPSRTESLLCVTYFSGPRAMQGAIKSAKGNLGHCDAFCDVELSPMRMVYIHSQVMALVEYATEGIMGALFAQAASSAVAVAADIANANASDTTKKYHIRATAFDFVLPQSARNPKHLSLHAGELKVVYISYSEHGSEAIVALSDVSLQDSSGEKMQEEPIRMDVNVKLPPIGVGTVEEQTMRVDISISSAAFLFSKAQYGQIMLTVDYNIGDYELYLRDEELGNSSDSVLTDTTEKDKIELGPLTHAGVAEVIIPRRMDVQVKISVLSIELFSAVNQPLILAAAVNANIVYLSLFDQEKRITDVTLGNLMCDDQRPRAVKRQYQSLIYQVERETEDGSSRSNSVQDVFKIKYESMDNGDTDYDLTIGSPRIVYVPDVLSEVMDFITVEGRATKTETLTLAPSITDGTDTTDYHVDNENLTVGVDEDEGGVEVSLNRSVSATDDAVSKMKVNISTSRCSIVLVDLGGDLSSIGSPRHSKSQASNQVIENLVMEGRVNVLLNFASDKLTGETTSTEINAHGDNVEIYTAFGRDMRSPLQILEPAEFSIALTKSTQRFELRMAALTPFNVCFSMRNYALISALLGGMGYGNEKPGESEQLSAVDEARIEKLASKLEGRADESTLNMSTAHSLRVSESFFRADSDSGAKSNLSYAVSIKLTLPEANLTVVNDLQGLDDALFRVTVATFVAGGELRKWLSPNLGAPPITTFDCHIHTSLMADYFDSSVNLWKKLLTKSWELALRGARGASKRFQSERLSTTFDIESFPCCLAFSEQFLVSIAAASRMWSIYSVATSSTTTLLKQVNVGDAHDSVAERGAASSAARNLITSLPYALENHFGIDVDFKLPGNRADRRTCPSGSMQYFRFEPPARLGYGGERLYGQDVLYKKSLQLFIGDAVVTIDDLDGRVGKPRKAHVFGNVVLFTNISDEGKTKVLHLSSSVNMVNATSIPFQISLFNPPTGSWDDVGICEGTSSMSGKSGTSFSPGGTSSVQDGFLSKPSTKFGIPCHQLFHFVNSWRKNRRVDTELKITPKFPDWAYPDKVEVHGKMDLHAIRDFLNAEETKSITTKFDVSCRADPKAAKDRRADVFVFRAHAQLSLVDREHLFVDISFEPRAVIVNNMPISLSVRTPMPHTTSDLCQHDDRESTHEVAPGSKIEVFTSGPSIAVNVKCADNPIAGTPMGWMETWVDLSLSPEFGLAEPLRCLFPFARRNKNTRYGGGGLEAFIGDGTSDFSSFFNDVPAGEMSKRASTASSYGLEVMSANSGGDNQRTFFITICNYAVDHTGNLLMEQYFENEQGQQMPSVPYSTFASTKYRRRITLLPRSTIPFRLLHMTMDGEKGVRSTVAFKIDNVAITQGGVGSTMIPWEDNTPSGYYAYRRLVTTDQSELHIIPEYTVYNGSTEHSIFVRQPGYSDIVVPPGKIKPVWIQDRSAGLILSLEYTDIGGFTPPLRVDNLGLRVAVLKALKGQPLGSIAIQTVIGAKDSRFVVKIGPVKRGSLDSSGSSSANTIIDLKRDFLRFRIQASELEVTLNEYKWTKKAISKSAHASPEKRRLLKEHETPVCTFLLQRFTVDWQRVFKDEEAKSARNLRRSVLLSPERSQLSLVIYSILIKDERPETTYPVVFNSTSRASFIDLCVRIRGPLDSDLIKVDLVDLNLAHSENESQKMYLYTSEDFVWKLLDVADRITGATAELASEGMKLKWDVEHGGYVIEFDESGEEDDTANYTPPRTGSIYDINRARVSPFSLNLTFKRNPQAARYAGQDVQGGAMVKYFTQRLKFKIDDAELSFGVYETNNLKGPSDRLVEVLQAVYMSRLKMKLVSIMTAASFQDWKTLANRTEGGDTFMEGDLVRVAGNLAGRTANMVFKNVGRGMGSAVTKSTVAVGNTFENATAKVGARAVGAGVNSILTGVGGGVADGVTGVGTGAGKLVAGIGKGTGQLIGGVTGGMLMAGKGIGEGLTRGDGRALVSGVSKGVNSVGAGVGQGVGTAVTGAADGFLSVGKGLFSGVKTVGKGLGGAFGGRQESKKNLGGKR